MVLSTKKQPSLFKLRSLEIVPLKGAHYLVYKGNTFIVNNGMTQIKFKTIKVDSLKFSIVIQDMVIYKGKPIQYKANIVALFGHQLIRDLIRYSLKF